jgi:hypothetical protein
MELSSKGQIVKVNLLPCSGLGLEPIIVYVRQETADQWKFLASLNTLPSFIYGPPGVGKSVITWAWACYSALKCDKCVLWTHCSRIHGVTYALLKEGKAAQFSLDNIQSLHKIDADILIIDGLTEQRKIELTEIANAWRSRGSQRKIIFVGSEQVSYYHEDAKMMESFKVLSWTLEDMKNACSFQEFFEFVKSKFVDDDSMNDNGKDIVDMSKIVEEKFNLTGGSVRWMFGMKATDVEKEIVSALDKCGGNQLSHLLSGLLGPTSQNVANHLLSETKDGICIVSKWASLQIVNRCSKEFLMAIKAHLLVKENPALDGWLFENDFFYQLKSAKMGKSQLEFLTGEKWDVPSQFTFRDPYDFVGQKRKIKGKPEICDNKMNIHVGAWLMPSKWNQVCYDAVQLLQNNKIRFVQVTRASAHTIKLYACRKIITALTEIGFTINECDFVIVVPEKFSCECKIEGSLNQIKISVRQLEIVRSV